jgi:hypothetical protein
MREEEPIIITPAQDLNVGEEVNTNLIDGGVENKSGVVNTPATPYRVPTFFKKDIEAIVKEILADTKFDIESIGYSTVAPTQDNVDGLKIVELSEEPATKYDGYLYFIEEE